MSRFARTEAVLLERLRSLKARPDMSINLGEIAEYMRAAGFTVDELMSVLDALEQEKIASRTTGNRLVILRELPPSG